MTTDPRKKAPSQTNTIAIGDTVTVLRLLPGRAPIIEGKAIVAGLAKAHAPNSYLVQFVGEPIVQRRTVHWDYQADASRMIEIMRDLWHAEQEMPASYDFFPDELP